MADNVTVTPGTGKTVRTIETVTGQVQVIRLDLGVGTAEALASGGVPVSGPLTDTQLRAAAIPATTRGNGVTYTDRSSTITLGGTAQQLAAANASRTGLMLQNTSAGDMRASSRGTASASAGILIKAGDLFIWPAHGVPVGVISIFGATTAQAFEAMEW